MNRERDNKKKSSLFQYMYHQMGGVYINWCDVLRGIEEHPTIDMNTRATGDKNTEMKSRNMRTAAQKNPREQLQYHITRLDLQSKINNESFCV